MFKKSIASIVSAAILVAGPGHLALTAAAQTMSRGPVTGISVTPTIGTGLTSPLPGASSFNSPMLSPVSLMAPSLLAAPSITPAILPVAAQSAKPMAIVATPVLAAAAKGSPLSVIASQDPKVGAAEKGAALNVLFENSMVKGHETTEVLGQSAESVQPNLAPYDASRAAASFPVNSYARYAAMQKSEAAGSLSDVSNLVKRAWNAVLGMLGIGVKKMETPAVMAQRIIDQLNAAKPVYNRKVQEASTLVEKLKLQVEGETKKVAELEQGITALLSDSDPTNDIMASGMINQQKTLAASVAASQEQIVLAEKTLEGIKEERARFFSEREETMAKIQAGLTKSAAADIQKQIAELKGGFQVGDLKDNMDKFEDAVNDKVADAKGTVDSVESNPDQILKKAKDSLKSQEIKDELAKRKAAIEQAKKDKGAAGGLILELGIGAAVIAVVAMISAPFRNLLARAWNAALGMLGMGVKKMETPEVMAQRIIDQLNSQKPVYNRKVQEASTLVEKLRLQIEKQTAQSADLDKSVTAILSDSDPLNDVMAESLLNQKKTVDASTVMTKEQLEISEKTLASIKEERASFFSEREEMLAKIQAGLTKSKSAEIQKQIAELKGGFQVGDLKDNMDKFEDAVNDKIADAKGTTDSVDSNPDQILKKAKDSLKNAEVNDEIAKRKAAIEQARKDKAAAGGDASQSKALGYFAKAIGIGFALISPWLSAAVFAVLGLVAIAMAPEQGRWLGRQLAVIGLGTLVIGGAATLAVAKLGLAVGAFGVGISFLVPAGIALAIGVIATMRAHKKEGATIASVASTPAGSSVMTPVTAPAAPSPKMSFSIKPLIDLMARAWNALLGIFGMGVKRMETPEILAQRLIDQLNDAKPVYNNKVREASTLVEKLRQQIEGENAKIADFDKTITALLSDNDPTNDIQAAGLLNSQKTLEASVAASKEQLSSSEKALENIKEERARFFAEREETLAKIQAGLTKSKSAEISKQIAELKGGFQIGDLKDNIDRFDGAVNDKIADAKGATDAVDSSPDQILKKAKDSLRTQQVSDELAARKAAIDQAKKDKVAAGGLILELGIGAAVIAVVAMISAPFRNLLARAWNAALGMLGMGVKKLETPEVMAQRIIDQLNSQKPVYNRKVQEASTLVEKLRLQIEKQTAQSAELDKSVTAILSDSDPLNDVMAESLLNQKKTVDASTAMTKEQLEISEKTLVSIKEERASFFSEREEMLAKIQAGLTKSKSAEIQKQIAELKGGFQVGDLKDNMDKFEDAVNDKIADAKGTTDSVDSNPDQILKKAKDSLKNSEVNDEIAKRKAAIEQARKDKAAAGGMVGKAAARGLTMTEFSVLNAVGMIGAVAAGFLLHSFAIGFVGLFVAAIPLSYAYVAIGRLLGANIAWPRFIFAPSMSWGGKR
jgi:phage shock protein A